MGLFGKKKEASTTPTQTNNVTPPPGAPRPPMPGSPVPPGAPRPPMASGPTPPVGAPRPPMPGSPVPPGAPRPPMASGPTPPPGAPRPPMPGSPVPPGAPRPPMPAGAMPPAPGAPRPPMASNIPASSMGPKPLAPSFGPSGPRPASPLNATNAAPGFNGPKSPMSSGPSFGPTNGANPPRPISNFGSPSANSFSTPSPSHSGSTNLDGILMSKKGYVAPRSIRAGGRVTYDEFCNEITYDFLDNLLKSQNLLEHKSLITKIKKTLIFALKNTKDLPDAEREILFTATLRFVDFLKGVVYYPEKDVMNEDVITYIPFLKDTAYAFRSFLLKNR